MQWKQYLSLGIAIFTCPCHLPLIVAALAGTALGGWLSQYTLVVTLGMAGIFMLAVLYSLRAFTRQDNYTDDSLNVGARDGNHAEDRGAGI
jgi:mercuric ion transport protein